MVAHTNTPFGDVADLYDLYRPGYPTALLGPLRDHLAGSPELLVELGAGTGKGTDFFTRLGAAMLCLEPDPRMAAVLTRRHPDVTVQVTDFEGWAPPPGGVPLLAAALSWHWVDPARRCALAHVALRPGGTLAVLGHTYGFADPAVDALIGEAISRHDPGPRRQPIESWVGAELTGSGLFTDVTAVTEKRVEPVTTEQYLGLTQTYSPFRRLPVPTRAALLADLRVTIDGLGGSIDMLLDTALVLARRP